MSDYILEARDITLVRGKKTILTRVNLNVRQGEILALIGPNGAGKSSLIQVLAGLLPTGTGQLLFQGKPVHDLLWYRRNLAVVFQDPLLISGSVWENASLGLSYRGLKSPDTKKRVNAWLERLGIGHLAGRKAHQLSGGEAQRLAIARALVLKPQILFLDEPFANLDTPTRTKLREELLGILKAEQITAVLVTHDFHELPMLATRVSALEEGRVVQTGSVNQILNKPVKSSLARLVGIENLWQPQKAERIPGGWKIQLPGGQTLRSSGSQAFPPRWVGIRPERIKPFSRSAINQFEGYVRSVLPYGTQSTVVLDCGIILRMMVPRDWAEGKNIGPGNRLKVSVSPQDIHLMHY